MKHLLIFMILTLTGQSVFAQSRSCYEDMLYTDTVSAKFKSVRLSAGFVGAGLSTAASAAAIIPLSVYLTMIGYESVKDNQQNRLMKLIEDSDSLLVNPQAQPSKFLRRIHRKVNRRLEEKITIEEFAQKIDKANQDRTLCDQRKFLSIAKLKRRSKKEGSLEFLGRAFNQKQEEQTVAAPSSSGQGKAILN